MFSKPICKNFKIKLEYLSSTSLFYLTRFILNALRKWISMLNILSFKCIGMLLWEFSISVCYSDKVIILNRTIDLKVFHGHNNF